MRPRTYALSFIISAAGLFLGVIGANLVIDPESVLGTGMLGTPLNPNTRFQQFVAYQAAPEKYDALFFGSSRALFISRDELTRRMNGIVFANFAVTAGLITDHLPVLEYVLREQARKGRRLHAVFLLLDVDSFGEQPRTNRFIQAILPPALSGEPTARFWWRYLTAIQIGTWRNEIARAWKGRTGEVVARAIAPLFEEAIAAPARAEPTAAAAEEKRDAGAGDREGERAVPSSNLPLDRVTTHPDYARQLQLLERLVALCRKNDVEIKVAMSPLSASNAATFDAADLAKAVEDISLIVPVWDFSASGPVGQRQELWLETSHFKPEVGLMMLARIFGDPMPEDLRDFGRLRGAKQ
jgi:hypothetical protein